ncbi:MAG: protein kinase [Acidobacteriaceae bacterium]|nr:protein kinase [Acidobacteriaceae bacterium]MBV9033085.1 protein kinase [Acidobacteriaceae bacterium]MBV9223728.1 protein kinase [Acidobacteriaceae bacterium]MBV9304921.1 protein kinase [Acidobacteriaceae bacterium]MBV9938281.1 protein kinase [Acidobacteriaceae bacterium]
MNNHLSLTDAIACLGTGESNQVFQSLPLWNDERFSLVREIGVGGLGCIYKAWDEVLGKYVALKMVAFSDPAVELRLRREAAIAQSLTHPSIVRIHDVVTVQGKACISMEYVEGPDLAEYLLQRGTLNVATVSNLAQQICSGLEAAHLAGVVHCDLKPSNLMLDGDRVRIVDFGLAIQTASPNGPRSGDGTPAYMSPEQKQQLPVDHRTDFYSLGLILFELLCGRCPTVAELEQVSAEKLRRPLRQVPGWMRKVIAKCLQYHPDDRYTRASDILLDLRRSWPVSLTQLKPVIKTKRLAFRLAWSAPVMFCLLAASYWSHLFAVSANYQRPSSPEFTDVALLPLQSQTPLEPLADGIDDYLRTVFQRFSGVRVWIPALKSRPSMEVLSHANIIITGQISQVGDYTTIHLSAEQGKSHIPLFSLTASAKTVFELEDQLWDKLTTNHQFSRFTTGVAKPAEYCQRRTETSSFYLRANSLIRRRRGTEDLREAVNLLNHAIVEDPRCALCYARKAAAELRLCDLNQDPLWLQNVLSDVQQAQDINEDSEQVIISAAQAYARTGRRKEAILLLRRAQKAKAAGSSGISRVLGGILADEGLYAEAITELKHAAQLNPLDVWSLNTLGATELMVPDYPAAIGAFTQILATDPENPYAQTNLASAYMRAGRFREAVLALETAIQKQPLAANYSNLGMALFFTGQGHMGLPFFEKAAALEPNSEVYVGNLAHAYRWSQASAQARPVYQKAIQLALREANTLRSSRVLADLGLYYAALGNVGSFHTYFQQARAESPSDLDVLYKEAVAASILGIPDRSFALLKKLCERGYPIALAEKNPDLSAIRRLPEYALLKQHKNEVISGVD